MLIQGKVYDENGDLIESYTVEEADPIPTAEERLDNLVAELASATTFAEVRAAAAKARRPGAG